MQERSDLISGSRPILQASAISTALMLTGRSSTLALASLAWETHQQIRYGVNFEQQLR
ncbi:hypothetical protein ACLB1O_32065 [Escherichia coli]